MSDHKAPTEVELAPKAEASAFQSLVRRLAVPAAVLAVVVSAAILIVQAMNESAAESRSAEWEEANAAVWGADQFPELDELSAIADANSDGEPGPWLLALLATKQIEEREYDAAGATLSRLESDFAGHALVTETFPFDDSGAELSVVARMRRKLGELQTWAHETPDLFGNPDPDGAAPRVRLTTSEGDVVVALYPERAPEHCAAITEWATNNPQGGLKFYKKEGANGLVLGDPEGRDDENVTPLEDSGLSFFEGYLAASRVPGKASEYQDEFVFALADSLGRSGTVFAKVVEGFDVIQRIAERDSSGDASAPGALSEPVDVSAASLEG